MAQYHIKGPSPLRGTVQVSGSRMAALWMTIAALLTEDKVTLSGVPHVRDIETMLDSLRYLGVEAGWTAPHEVTIHAQQLTSVALPLSLPSAMTTSTLFFGALLARHGLVALPAQAEQESLRQQSFLEQLHQFGIRFSIAEGGYQAHADQLRSTRLTFSEHTLSGTVLALYLSVLAEGQTVIDGAAAEPEVDDLIGLLNAMGAHIMRVDERTLIVDGVRRLHGASYTVMPDPLNVVVFGCAAIVSGGDILVRGAKQTDVAQFLAKLQQLEASYQVSREGIRFWSQRGQRLRPVKLELKPYPGFLPEWLPFLLPLLSMVDGASDVLLPTNQDEGVITGLRHFGLEAQMVNGSLQVFGPTVSRSAAVRSESSVEAAAFTIAAFGALGASEISGVELLDGMLEHPEERWLHLGAKLSRQE